MIKIEIPSNYQAERHYILSVMFTEFLGLDIQVKVNVPQSGSLRDRQNVSITRNDDRKLLVAEGLFATPPEHWLQPASLPKQPLKVWNLATTKLAATTVNPQIPVIYGDNPNNPDFFYQSEEKIYLGLDIFGSAFFMLTRYEEVVKSDRDQHDRFPATASLAYQEGFLDRPIINEYLEILWSCIKQLWPGLHRQPRRFQIYVSHDVDEPFRYAFTGISRLIKRFGGDILKRRNLGKAFNSISNYIQVKTGNPNADQCNTFDLIMDISEEYNLKSAFYFITADSGGDIKRYSIDHPLIRGLLRNIARRGHEIGLHPSYNSYKDAIQTKKEFEILTQVCAEEAIQQELWGGRQHYLRWETPTTLQNWEDAGLDYDSTLCFADLPGFRCGVCYQFPFFNIKTRQQLKLREYPLIVMECTLISELYMGLYIENNSALKTIKKYKQCCNLFHGEFRLLWHNSQLIDRCELQLYRQVISQ